jgi:hypothetical protein
VTPTTRTKAAPSVRRQFDSPPDRIGTMPQNLRRLLIDDHFGRGGALDEIAAVHDAKAIRMEI